MAARWLWRPPSSNLHDEDVALGLLVLGGVLGHCVGVVMGSLLWNHDLVEEAGIYIRSDRGIGGSCRDPRRGDGSGRASRGTWAQGSQAVTGVCGGARGRGVGCVEDARTEKQAQEQQRQGAGGKGWKCWWLSVRRRAVRVRRRRRGEARRGRAADAIGVARDGGRLNERSSVPWSAPASTGDRCVPAPAGRAGAMVTRKCPRQPARHHAGAGLRWGPPSWSLGGDRRLRGWRSSLRG